MAIFMLAGCSGASEFLSKDAEWFSRPSRMFGGDTRVGAGLLTPSKAVAPNDLVGADGSCAGMAPAESADTTASASATAPAFTLESAECDVVRYAGVPDSTDITANERGERAVVMTYLKGPRPGIYRFASGRLVSMERGPQAEPVKPARPAKSVKSKKSA